METCPNRATTIPSFALYFKGIIKIVHVTNRSQVVKIALDLLYSASQQLSAFTTVDLSGWNMVVAAGGRRLYTKWLQKPVSRMCATNNHQYH
jgi:hypothetical protein